MVVLVWWCFCGGVVAFLWWCLCFCGGAFVCFVLSGVDFRRITEKLCKEC